jgi:hypothetical protein
MIADPVRAAAVAALPRPGPALAPPALSAVSGFALICGYAAITLLRG